jgi:hypothetical protein
MRRKPLLLPLKILRSIVAVSLVMGARQNQIEHDNEDPNLDAGNHHEPKWPDWIISQYKGERKEVKD